eukprot:14055979-Heterocapsa_arctica.AAC.1
MLAMLLGYNRAQRPGKVQHRHAALTMENTKAACTAPGPMYAAGVFGGMFPQTFRRDVPASDFGGMLLQAYSAGDLSKRI